MFPGAQRMNRGRHEVGALVRACKANGVTDLLVVHRHRAHRWAGGGLGAARWLARSRGSLARRVVLPVGLVSSHLPFGPTRTSHCATWS